MRFIIIYLIVFFALIQRLYTVITVAPEQYVLTKDAADYNNIALNLIGGKGFALTMSNSAIKETTGRPPAYPFFLAGIYLLFGYSLEAVWITQSIIGALTCLFVFLIGSKLFNFSTGVLTSLVMSIYPSFVKYLYYGGPTFVLTETLYTFLLILSIFFLVIYFLNRRLINVIFAAVFCGLSALTRPIIILLPIFLFFWFFILRDKKLNWVKHFLIFCACFFLTTAPWTMRNFLVSGRLIPISSQTGEAFWAGNNSLAKGGTISNTSLLPEYNPNEFTGLTEVQVSNLKFRKGIEYLLSHPQRIPFLFLKKVLVFWSPRENRQINYHYLIVGLFAFCSMWVLIFKKRFLDVSLFLTLFLYFSFMAMVFSGDPRYRLPIEPYLIILASDFAVNLYKRNVKT